ncbi:hypothetical protein RRG08_033681 [Elysia crispata]|uniref:Uncharacterized protein n=1 Tax=Elysia crispata TaxID=231223 RepID=A0AAE1DV27_9GAST|nr:hypothetical protein RRG08_033681 [Elysia crispata]
MIDKALTSTGSERKGQSLSSGLRIASVVKQELTPQRLEVNTASDGAGSLEPFVNTLEASRV